MKTINPSNFFSTLEKLTQVIKKNEEEQLHLKKKYNQRKSTNNAIHLKNDVVFSADLFEN